VQSYLSSVGAAEASIVNKETGNDADPLGVAMKAAGAFVAGRCCWNCAVVSGTARETRWSNDYDHDYDYELQGPLGVWDCNGGMFDFDAVLASCIDWIGLSHHWLPPFFRIHEWNEIGTHVQVP